MMPREYQIVVVDGNMNWRKATAPALVRDVGVPPKVAARWAKVRREMSPAGLRRKLKGSVN
jgi:hypothetical protein